MNWNIDTELAQKARKAWDNSTVEQRVKFLSEHGVEEKFLFYAERKFNKLPDIFQAVVLNNYKPLLY